MPTHAQNVLFEGIRSGLKYYDGLKKLIAILEQIKQIEKNDQVIKALNESIAHYHAALEFSEEQLVLIQCQLFGITKDPQFTRLRELKVDEIDDRKISAFENLVLTQYDNITAKYLNRFAMLMQVYPKVLELTTIILNQSPRRHRVEALLRKELGHADLSHLLVTPVQRICKYPLFIKEMKFPNKEVDATVDRFVTAVNEKKGELEAQDQETLWGWYAKNVRPTLVAKAMDPLYALFSSQNRQTGPALKDLSFMATVYAAEHTAKVAEEAAAASSTTTADDSKNSETHYPFPFADGDDDVADIYPDVTASDDETAGAHPGPR